MGVCLRKPRDSHQDMIKILSLILMAGLLADTRAVPINGFTVNAGDYIEGDLIIKRGQVGTISETVSVDCAEPSQCVGTLRYNGNAPVFPLSPDTEYNTESHAYDDYDNESVGDDWNVEDGEVGIESVNCAEPSQCPGANIHTVDGPENTENNPERQNEGNDNKHNIEGDSLVGHGEKGPNKDYYDTAEFEDSDYSIDCTESAICSSMSYHYGDQPLFPSRDTESPEVDNSYVNTERLNEENNDKVLINTEFGIIQDGQVGKRNLAHEGSEVDHESPSENSDVVINCGGSAQCFGTRIYHGDQTLFE